MDDKCGSSTKCTNKGCNPEKKPEVCGSSGGVAGFFGKIFGSGESSPDTSGRCQDCGMEKCNCNCALRDHLKQCCGYGQLPKLIDSCDAVNPPKKKVDECASECNFKVPDTTCSTSAPAPTASAVKCSTTTGSTAAVSNKCPPMPCTDVTGCIPTWLCPPISAGMRTYPSPAGVKIYPISVGGRKREGYTDSRCSSCGTTNTGEKRAAPKVSKDCPMVRPRCPGEAGPEGKVGIFERIKNFFGFGKKSS